MLESEVQYQIRLALGRLPDVKLFRNNVGVAKIGKSTVRFGLAKGSSDLIGWITHEIEGRRVARFLSLEIKTDTGRVAPEQELWLALVRRHGGFACVVRGVSDALEAVERARKGEYE